MRKTGGGLIEVLRRAGCAAEKRWFDCVAGFRFLKCLLHALNRRTSRSVAA